MTEQKNQRREPWFIDDSEFYELESREAEMEFLLRYAVLAPSGHNTQPWKFAIVPEGIEVFADYSRRLPQIDPDDRELIVLKHLDGWTYDELAQRLEIPRGTVMSRLFHARQRLQALISGEKRVGR